MYLRRYIVERKSRTRHEIPEEMRTKTQAIQKSIVCNSETLNPKVIFIDMNQKSILGLKMLKFRLMYIKKFLN